MSLRVVFPNSFTRKANRLARKHPSLTSELRALHVALSRGLKPGDRLQGTGAEVYKVRLVNPSGRSGKRGGFRVAYHVGNEQITLLAVCRKPKCDAVRPQQILRILRDLALN